MTNDLFRARCLRAVPRCLLGAALLATALAAPARAQAQDWPTKPVKLVVTYPPGGTVDAVGRILAPRLAAGWASRW